MGSKKRRRRSTDDSVGSKLECYYRSRLGGPFSPALTRPATCTVESTVAAIVPLYASTTNVSARRLTLDYVDMVLDGGSSTYRERLVSRWASDVAEAWLPDASLKPTPTSVKILRKGAPNQPLSVRYLHAQLERACSRAPVDAATELLTDIVVSHARGMFAPPPVSLCVASRRRLLSQTPMELFDAHFRGKRSMVLHGILRSFLVGVSMAVSATMRHAMTRPSLSSTIPLPALAYRGIFRRVLGVVTRPSLTAAVSLPRSSLTCSGAAAVTGVTAGATAKRAKIVAYNLCASDRRALVSHCGRCPVASIVPLSLDEQALQSCLPERRVYLCRSCPSWRPFAPVPRRRGVVVDLCRPGTVLCGECGSSDLVCHVLNGHMVAFRDPWRLCSQCGAPGLYSSMVHHGVSMVCRGCVPTVPRPCCVCGSSATATTVATADGAYVEVGLCRTHDISGDALPLSVTVAGLRAFASAAGCRTASMRAHR